LIFAKFLIENFRPFGEASKRLAVFAVAKEAETGGRRTARATPRIRAQRHRSGMSTIHFPIAWIQLRAFSRLSGSQPPSVLEIQIEHTNEIADWLRSFLPIPSKPEQLMDNTAMDRWSDRWQER
jgi:hypothetical protein